MNARGSNMTGDKVKIYSQALLLVFLVMLRFAYSPNS